MAIKTLDEIATSNPITTIDGTETFILQQGGVTKGGAVSNLKTYVKTGFVSNDITNASAIGKTVLTAANASDLRAAVGASAIITNATTATKGVVNQGVAVTSVAGSPTAADVGTALNALLTSLRTAGVIVT